MSSAYYSSHVNLARLSSRCFPNVSPRSNATAVEMRIITEIGRKDRTHRIVVIPENVGGWFWTLQDDAREIDGATSIDE